MKDFRTKIIKRCKKAGACEEEFKALLSAGSDVEFMDVLIRNHSWCVGNNIYTAMEIESLPKKLLQECHIATKDTQIVDFDHLVEIRGIRWMPFNIGADRDNPYGDYLDFDEAQTKATEPGLRVPTWRENRMLSECDRKFAVYFEVFGELFDNKLFLPFSGTRYNTTGDFGVVGSIGYYWSSSASSSAYGYYLRFESGSVSPSNYFNRASGFAVRCVLE